MSASRATRHDVAGLSLVRRRAAEAPTSVLLLHGAMDRAASFGRVMRRLSEFDTIALDRRGYGESVDAGPPASLREHAEDAIRVLDWSGATSVVVVGHSLGGRIALEVAASGDPRIRAVAAFEPPAPELDGSRERVGGGAIEIGRREGPAAAAEHFYRRMIGETTWERVRERDRAARRAEGPALLAELEDLRDGHRVELDQIDVPIVLGAGSTTSETLRSGALALSERLPRATFYEIVGAGHGAHLTHPDEFARYIRTSVATAEAPRAANPFESSARGTGSAR